MTRIAILLALIGGFLAYTASAQAEDSTYWKQLGGASEVEPTELTTSYGTSSSTMQFQNLVWQGWGEDQAIATGTALVKGCRPNCLTGGLSEGDAKVYLTEIRSICGQRRYMHVRVSATNLPKGIGPYYADYDDVSCRGNMVNPGGRPYPNRVPKPKNPTRLPRVVCITDSTSPSGVYRIRPRGCTTHRRGFPFDSASLQSMRKLHWKHWGRRSAVGRGLLALNMVGYQPVRIRLYRPRNACGATSFTRLKGRYRSVTGPGWFRFRLRISSCLD